MIKCPHCGNTDRTLIEIGHWERINNTTRRREEQLLCNVCSKFFQVVEEENKNERNKV